MKYKTKLLREEGWCSVLFLFCSALLVINIKNNRIKINNNSSIVINIISRRNSEMSFVFLNASILLYYVFCIFSFFAMLFP